MGANIELCLEVSVPMAASQVTNRPFWASCGQLGWSASVDAKWNQGYITSRLFVNFFFFLKLKKSEMHKEEKCSYS